MRPGGLGLTAVGQRLEAGRALLNWRVIDLDRDAVTAGSSGFPRGTVTRMIAHVPFGWQPPILQVRVSRYRRVDCCTVWRQNISKAVAARGKVSRDAIYWALKSVVIDPILIARVAANVGTTWHTVHDTVLEAGSELLINDPHRFDRARVFGVDENVRSHTGRGSKYDTVIIDLSPIRDGTGPSRLLDMFPGRSKTVFKDGHLEQEPVFRDRIETVAIDGFTGFETAASDVIPQATTAIDPLHVVALAGDALDRCQQRIQQVTCGHRGRSGEPLYGIRRPVAL